MRKIALLVSFILALSVSAQKPASEVCGVPSFIIGPYVHAHDSWNGAAAEFVAESRLHDDVILASAKLRTEDQRQAWFVIGINYGSVCPPFPIAQEDTLGWHVEISSWADAPSTATAKINGGAIFAAAMSSHWAPFSGVVSIAPASRARVARPSPQSSYSAPEAYVVWYDGP